MRITHRLQKLFKAGVVFFRHLQAHQNPAVVRALVSVMKQTDVPTSAHGGQKFHQRAGFFREHKPQQTLVLRQWRAATHHVAYVFLRQIVVCQIQGFEPVLAQVRSDLAALSRRAGGQSHKHMGFLGVTDAVIEFGDGARCLAAAECRQVAQHTAKPFETAALFGNGHGKQCFAFFTDLGALGDKPQAIKIDVGAAQHGCIGFTLGFVQRHVFFDRCHRHGTGWLHDAARVNKHIFDRCAHGVRVNADKFVHQTPCNAKRFFAHQLDGGSISKQTHVVQCNAFARVHRLPHGV